MTNVIEWLLTFADTLKSTFGEILTFLTYEINVGNYSFTVYQSLFGTALFLVIIWGIASFILDIMP